MSNRNRDKGNGYERQIAKELRELGFEGIKTSRSESKSTDDDKIDFVDTKGQFPVYLQAKKTVNIPNYFKIRSECSKNPEDFCIIWNKQEKKNKNFSSVGELVMISKQLFYKLIKLYGARDEESESAGGS